ncbi:MAG: ribosomal-processing cysteine protease Prp [Bacilli bacterium]|nr:ribosomal-processing cysteine protease Prp [Bacilli bacterium]
MIKVNVIRNGQKLETIKIKGHAMYDEYGKDIVCSSVSSITVTTVNALLSINEDFIRYEENSGCVTIDVITDDDICFKLLENMLMLFSELSEKYPKNIKIM